MKRLAQVISFLALAATVAGPVLFFCDELNLDQTKVWILIGAVVWFIATPFWMEHKA